MSLLSKSFWDLWNPLLNHTGFFNSLFCLCVSPDWLLTSEKSFCLWARSMAWRFSCFSTFTWKQKKRKEEMKWNVYNSVLKNTWLWIGPLSKCLCNMRPHTGENLSMGWVSLFSLFTRNIVLLKYRLRTCLFTGSGLSHFVFDVSFWKTYMCDPFLSL